MNKMNDVFKHQYVEIEVVSKCEYRKRLLFISWFIPAFDEWVRFLTFAERSHGSTGIEYQEGCVG